jgi:dTDP-4-dehydrorhamnose reductase
MRILILGASGMLGHKAFQVLLQMPDWTTFGTIRSERYLPFFPDDLKSRLIESIDVLQDRDLELAIERAKPDCILNCVGLVKQVDASSIESQAMAINADLPRRLAHLGQKHGIRIVHFSTDCVFSGNRGLYSEIDAVDAIDLYGKSKALGEMVGQPGVVTLRTSIIGPELHVGAGMQPQGLLEWFLAQQNQCFGYTKAIFSGFPTVILAQIVRDYVIPNDHLMGVYHVSSAPISKYNLLCEIAKVYGKDIHIIPDAALVIDRSLDSSLFQEITGFVPKSWPEMIKIMHADRGFHV